MKAKRWSFSGLERAETCLHQFNEVRNLKKYPDEADSEEAVWGRYVHKAFEDRQATRTELPLNLAQHEPFMQRMESWDGFFFTEQKVALDKQLKPVSEFFDKSVWWSGIIDYTKIEYLAQRARIVDYKTGKRRPKPNQLVQNALWTFQMYPDIEIVDAFFYWTTEAHLGDGAIDRYVYTRDQIPEMWSRFTASLGRLFAAYAEDKWPMKPGPLCYGWCPVTDCPHWKPKKEKR
jgi:hypothetical protein